MNDRDAVSSLGFIPSLAGVCRGVAIFPQLVRHGWIRTLWHLVIISFICAVGVTVGQSSRLSASLGEFEREFNAFFGKVELSRGSILPSMSPERARSIQFMPEGRLFYVPEWSNGINMQSNDIRAFHTMIFWSPRRLMLAMDMGEERGWYVARFQPVRIAGEANQLPLRDGYFSADTFDAAELGVLLKEKYAPASGWNFAGKGQLGAEEFAFGFLSMAMTGMFIWWDAGFLTLAIIGVLVWWWIGFVALSLIYVMLFAGMFKLTGGIARLKSLSFGEFVRCGIYAGFPVMMVAACFPALDLPFFNASTIYMCGQVVYWLIAAGRMESAASQSGAPGPGGKHGEQ